jgi:carboxylesterase type B
MIMKGITTLVTAVLLGRAVAAPPEPPAGVVEKRAAPTVTIASGTIVGTTSSGAEAFHGIPFAQPPVGPLRLKPPVKLNRSLGVFDASSAAPACPQMVANSASKDLLSEVLTTVANTALFQQALKISEDCLNIDVYRPAGTKAGAKLPVLFWIFGGGFEVCVTTAIVRRSGLPTD